MKIWGITREWFAIVGLQKIITYLLTHFDTFVRKKNAARLSFCHKRVIIIGEKI